MDIDLEPGRYVVAVSGGVDSVTLLDLLAGREDLRLTVAHFDHGIREDSFKDLQLVRDLARQYGIPFVYADGELGPGASEAQAREARYVFLHTVRRSAKAQAIVTAHHQDDVLETAILNLLRGTGSRGLSSLRSIDSIRRPLLNTPKKQLLRYAEREGLKWREDSTNADPRYLRNYVRLNIMPRFAEADREALLNIVGKAEQYNRQLLCEAINYLHTQPIAGMLDRNQLIQLPHQVAGEVMAHWLRLHDVEVSTKRIERLVAVAKTGRIGSKVDVDKACWLRIDRNDLALVTRER